jgi:hypothetical protein
MHYGSPGKIFPTYNQRFQTAKIHEKNLTQVGEKGRQKSIERPFFTTFSLREP